MQYKNSKRVGVSVIDKKFVKNGFNFMQTFYALKKLAVILAKIPVGVRRKCLRFR